MTYVVAEYRTMNKIVIIVFLLNYTIHAYSQIPFGIKGGVNRNDIVIENAPFLPIGLYQPNVGFHVGLFGEVRVFKLRFHPELLFVQRGANSHIYLQGSLNPASESRINLNYIELPVMFTLYKIRSLALETGPTLSYKISTKEISDNGKKDVTGRFNKPFDFGINFGLKVQIYSRVFIVGRYYHGLLSVLQFPSISPNTFPSSSLTNIQVGLHYLLKN